MIFQAIVGFAHEKSRALLIWVESSLNPAISSCLIAAINLGLHNIAIIIKQVYQLLTDSRCLAQLSTITATAFEIALYSLVKHFLDSLVQVHLLLLSGSWFWFLFLLLNFLSLLGLVVVFGNCSIVLQFFFGFGWLHYYFSILAAFLRRSFSGGSWVGLTLRANLGGQ